MECRDAQFYLRLRRHAGDELGPDVTAPLDDHLATCPACAADARAAASFDTALGAAMRAVPVPAGLRERLVAHVAAKRGTVLRHRMYRAGAAVAAALLLVGIGLGWFSNNRPKPDTYAMVEDLNEQWHSPKQSTERWLAAQKLPTTLPQPFDYNLLVGRGFEEMKGRNVPVVTFRSADGELAKVYIFRDDGRFNLKALQPTQVSGTQALVIADKPEFRGFTYVIVYTGRDLQPFLLRANAGALGA
jgi:hypothetical protein